MPTYYKPDTARNLYGGPLPCTYCGQMPAVHHAPHRRCPTVDELAAAATPQPHTVAGLWPCFRATDWLTIPGRGRSAITTLDRTTQDFAHLVGQEVIIDGTLYVCRAVERFLHSPPWQAGESIGLLVEELPHV
jgi:hypothetical protein